MTSLSMTSFCREKISKLQITFMLSTQSHGLDSRPRESDELQWVIFYQTLTIHKTQRLMPFVKVRSYRMRCVAVSRAVWPHGTARHPAKRIRCERTFTHIMIPQPKHIFDENKNSSGDEIANVNFLTTISHTRRPTSKYRKRDKPTSFNKLDDR